MAAYDGYYITQTDVESRLSAAVVRRIYDDGNTGAANEDTITRLIKDAESKFEGYCRGIYDLDSMRRVKPPEAIRLCLDIAEAFACKRFPHAACRDWQPLLESVENELTELRKGLTRMDVIGLPEPAANQGGVIAGSDWNNPNDISDPTFLNSWGSF